MILQRREDYLNKPVSSLVEAALSIWFKAIGERPQLTRSLEYLNIYYIS